ncbi:Uncharacterised protein [Chlamydia trachomatis]|nr:Uncharacterised protein [Chlamydia trachomatis]
MNADESEQCCSGECIKISADKPHVSARFPVCVCDGTFGDDRATIKLTEWIINAR